MNAGEAPEVLMVRCSGCRTEFALGTVDMTDVEGNSLCPTCVELHTVVCYECEEIRWQANTTACDDCERIFCDEQEHDCSGDDRSVNWRKYSKTTAVQDTTPGIILTHTRKFGVEIECAAPTDKAMAQASHELNGIVGVSSDGSIHSSYGMEFQTPIISGAKGEQLIHSITDTLVKHDFSVDVSCGLHVHLDMSDFLPEKIDASSATAKARLESAEGIMNSYKRGSWTMTVEPPELYATYKAAWDRGGFTPEEKEHIINNPFMDKYAQRMGKDINQNILANLKAVLQFYTAFDDTILSFLPISRRSNDYCKPFRSYFSLKELGTAKTHANLEAMWYRLSASEIVDAKRDMKHGSRRKGINLHTFFKEGHVEIRYHSGTLNASKILYWVQLHCAILEYAKNIDVDILYDIGSEIRLEKKAELMFDLLRLDAGAKTYFRARQKKFNSATKEVAILAKKKEPKTCVV